MDAKKLLENIQIRTNTSPSVWDEDSYNWLFDDLTKNIGSCNKEQLHQSIQKTVDEMYSCALPTKYESSLHYPLLYSLLKELYDVRTIFKNVAFIDIGSPMPLIGTANFQNINAFAEPKYKLIVIDRSLHFFLSCIVTILVEFITTNNNDRFVIRPSLITREHIIDKINSNRELPQIFLEIICSYVLFRDTWPYKRYHYGNEEKHTWHEFITKEVYRFVVSHELAHLLLNDTQSSVQIEQDADYVGAYLCVASICKDKEIKDMDLFWAMSITVKTMDILYKCDSYFKNNNNSYPANRIQTINTVLVKASADEYVLGMVSAIDMIFEILWSTIKSPLEALTKAWNDGRISSIKELQQLISIIN